MLSCFSPVVEISFSLIKDAMHDTTPQCLSVERVKRTLSSAKKTAVTMFKKGE